MLTSGVFQANRLPKKGARVQKKSRSSNVVTRVATEPTPVNVKDQAKPVTLGDSPTSGLFTSTDPELRRIVPEDINDRTVVKVVYVVLEAQYQSSLSAAVKNINQTNDKVCFEVVGYLLEELRDESNYEMFQKDLDQANVFIGSLIFIEELAEKIVAAVQPKREKLDACLIFPSMPAVMKMNKLGSFEMSQLGGKKSIFGEMMKSARKNNEAFEENLLKLVRTLPKILKYLPMEKAQDARNFISSLQYWLGGNSQNLENLLVNVAQEYVPALKDAGMEVAEPELFPEVGIWHPLAPRMFEDVKEYLNWNDARKDIPKRDDTTPTIGLVLQRSHLVTGDAGHYEGVVADLEARGARVITAFAGGLDFSSPVKKFFYDPLRPSEPMVDTVVSLTGFALVGGPARQDAPKAVTALKKLGVPYIVSLPLVFQTTEEWLGSELGVHPVQVALQVALPELDGGLEPIVFAGRDSNTGKSHSLPDRIDALCNRAIKWASLRKKARADKKVAITIFSFPPDKGNVGTAAYLNVFGSIHRVLKNLKSVGYNVGDIPETSEELVSSVLNQEEARFNSADLNVAYKMSVNEYQQLCPYADALEENWGKPPGQLNTNGQELLIFGKQFGNVFIGVQPTFGYEGDPMRLLFSRSASPHHGFAAFYTYLEKIFNADAVLHFGTHGSLEFMPGKQVGMSGVCYPDSLIGSIPNIYYYAANNPSEATIAKRRSYANTISYLTPPAENAGLYKGLKELKELISSYQGMRESGRAAAITSTICETARQCNLDRDVELPEDNAELDIEARDLVVGNVYRKLMEIESRLLPCGLHVIGEPPSAQEAVATLVNIAEIDRPDGDVPLKGLPRIMAESIGRSIDDIYKKSDKGVLEDVDLLQRITEACRAAVGGFVDDRTGGEGKVTLNAFQEALRFAKIANQPWLEALKGGEFKNVNPADMENTFKYLEFCLEQVVKDQELSALSAALDGKYVEPGPGGDPIRNPSVLPTGKNIHALDPQSIPTAAACKSAKDVVDRLIEREKDNNGGVYPESIALVLWGTDNIKTYGESLAQVLWMVGVRPVPDALGRVNKLEVVSLEELGRPRIDVVVNCSGVFRDLFINQMNLLDRGIKMAAELDEDLSMNFVRKHALEQAEQLGVSLRDAATRVFSNSSGSYSSNVNLAVENSSWQDEEQLQEMYLKRKSFAFNSDRPGAGGEESREVFEAALGTVDVTFQNLDSSEISLTDVSHYFDSDPTNLVQSVRKDGRKPNAYIADTTTANAQVRTLSETVRLDARTKLLNPKWYEGMMGSGYEGVREIQKRLTNTMGWSATSGQVDNWVYDEANNTFIDDPEMAQRMLDANPNSFRKLVATFLEANGRGYWEASEEQIAKLRQMYTDVEDKIEGVE